MAFCTFKRNQTYNYKYTCIAICAQLYSRTHFRTAYICQKNILYTCIAICDKLYWGPLFRTVYICQKNKMMPLLYLDQILLITLFSGSRRRRNTGDTKGMEENKRESRRNISSSLSHLRQPCAIYIM